MNTISYTVPAISCNHCVHTIKTEVSELSGVLSIEADLNSKKVQISFEDPATPEKIEALLAEINYPVAK